MALRCKISCILNQLQLQYYIHSILIIGTIIIYDYNWHNHYYRYTSRLRC